MTTSSETFLPTIPGTLIEIDTAPVDLATVVDRLDAIESKLDHLTGLLDEFEPIIRAYLGDAASGPVAWAVRRQRKKG
jgi:hypothetical protein